MGRPRKIPFKITPVICRYLRDIQFGKEDIDDPTLTTSSGDWFLITTWRSKEDYDAESEQNLESMKTYLMDKGLARFPTLQDYEKKLGIQFSDDDTWQYLHHPDTNERFVFEKSFPVEVLNLEAIKEFRKTYCLKEQSTPASTQYQSRQKLRFENSTLSYPDRKPYTFRNQVALRVFTELWNEREHFVKGEAKPDKIGTPKTLIKFMLKVRLASVNTASRQIVDSAKKEIRGIVGNARRDFNSKGLSVKLECKAEKVLLTVKEK